MEKDAQGGGWITHGDTHYCSYYTCIVDEKTMKLAEQEKKKKYGNCRLVS